MKRPLPKAFWAGLLMMAPMALPAAWAGVAGWRTVMAAWGFWLALDGLAQLRRRPSLLQQVDAAVWAFVSSALVWACLDYANEYLPVWGVFGLPFHPLIREAALGLLGAPVIPTVLSSAALLGSSRRRLLWLAAGAALWTASDLLWSAVGPAERVYVGYTSEAILPVALWACALGSTLLYGTLVDVVDKPRFDPFGAPEEV